MDSGIYKITFSSGYYYIGKSTHIPQRWKTHQSSFEKGKHTKKMQAQYDQYGPPKYLVLLSVHPDHLEQYEQAVTDMFWSDLILNTTRPHNRLTADQIQEYMDVYDSLTFNGSSCMQYSTLQLAHSLREQYTRAENLSEQLGELNKRGVVLPETARLALDELQAENQVLESELAELHNRSWWQRLWNYSV